MKTYQCPCCGAPLAYAGESGKLECASCGNGYALEDVEALASEKSTTDVHFEMETADFGEGNAAVQSLICQSCGAELMTDSTTTATECPYCGSPVVMPERMDGDVRPRKIVPFVVTREQAQEKFAAYFKGKPLLPNVFAQGRNRISDIRKLYAPYWLFSCDAHGRMTFDAERETRERQGDWEITRTEHYLVMREGDMGFDDVPVDAIAKIDDEITESLEPYDMSAARPFEPAMLAGAVADRADVDAQTCEARAAARVENSVASALRDTVTGYTRVTERSRAITAQSGTATPVLLPVWLITTEKQGRTYTFAINGQTGELTCNVPADKGKVMVWGLGVFAGVMALAALVLYFSEMLESGTLLMAGVLALIAAIIVVACLTAQLRQASYRSGAGGYVREGALQLDRHSDHFLYEHTERRKIEQPAQQNEEPKGPPRGKNRNHTIN